MTEKQTTLFGEEVDPIVKKPYKEKVEPFITEPSNVVVHKAEIYGWEQLPSDNPKAYLHLELQSKTTITDDDEYRINRSETHEQQRGCLGSMWSSAGETFEPTDLESIQKYFDEVLQHKKEDLKSMYRAFSEEEKKAEYNHHNLYYFYRLIPADRYFVIISDKLVKLMKEAGFDFDAWYKEYRDLPENPATDESWMRVKKTLNLYRRGEQLHKEIYLLTENNRRIYLKKTEDEIKQLGEELYKISQELGDIYILTRGSKPNTYQWGHTLDQIGLTTDYGKIKTL